MTRARISRRGSLRDAKIDRCLTLRQAELIWSADGYALLAEMARGGRARAHLGGQSQPSDRRGLGERIELLNTEMYGEPFTVLEPLETVFISWIEGGEVFRSGLNLSARRWPDFLFRTRARDLPDLLSSVRRVLRNAVEWAYNPAPGWTNIGNAPNVPVIELLEPLVEKGPKLQCAFAAGKHVFCEKPLAPSYPDALRMVEAAETAGIVNMVNLTYRNSPALQEARKLVPAAKSARSATSGGIPAELAGWKVLGRLAHGREMALAALARPRLDGRDWRRRHPHSRFRELLRGRDMTSLHADLATFAKVEETASATMCSTPTTAWSSPGGWNWARWRRSPRPATRPATQTISG